MVDVLDYLWYNKKEARQLTDLRLICSPEGVMYMRYTIMGKNIEVTESLKAAAGEKAYIIGEIKAGEKGITLC